MGINTFPAASASGVNYTGGSQASRPASPTTGNTFFNTTDNSLEIYNGTDWVTIQETNDSPVWTTASGSLGTVTEGEAVSFTVTATDPEGGTISYSSTDLPAGVSVNSSTGVISGTAPAVNENTTVTFNITASDGLNQKSRQFSMAVINAIPVEYLVIAGGASGGMGDASLYGGGGGGAGGYRTGTKGLVPSTNYTVTIGAGGSAKTSFGTGNSGSNSVFATITSSGGGGGGTRSHSPNNGGSGGGAARNENGGLGNAGSYSPVEGYDGGTQSNVSNAGSGGGGAGAIGSNANLGSTIGGTGGTGAASTITGTSVYRGGGGSGNGSTIVSGGTGGGGAGASYTSGTGNGSPGDSNTGGGGGGGGSNSQSGAGGSGVVILRWLTSAASITVGAGLTADATGTDGSYSYKVFTAGSGNVSFA